MGQVGGGTQKLKKCSKHCPISAYMIENSQICQIWDIIFSIIERWYAYKCGWSSLFIHL